VGHGGHNSCRGYNFLNGKVNENHQFGTGLFAQHRIVSALKRVEFIKDKLSTYF